MVFKQLGDELIDRESVLELQLTTNVQMCFDEMTNLLVHKNVTK